MDDQKTAADVERLQQALKAERRLKRDAEREVTVMQRTILDRLEALEARPATLGPVLDGLAEIRRDVMAEVAQLRAEIDDLAATVAQVMRQP